MFSGAILHPSQAHRRSDRRKAKRLCSNTKHSHAWAVSCEVKAYQRAVIVGRSYAKGRIDRVKGGCPKASGESHKSIHASRGRRMCQWHRKCAKLEPARGYASGPANAGRSQSDFNEVVLASEKKGASHWNARHGIATKR